MTILNLFNRCSQHIDLNKTLLGKDYKYINKAQKERARTGHSDPCEAPTHKKVNFVIVIARELKKAKSNLAAVCTVVVENRH